MQPQPSSLRWVRRASEILDMPPHLGGLVQAVNSLVCDDEESQANALHIKALDK